MADERRLAPEQAVLCQASISLNEVADDCFW